MNDQPKPEPKPPPEPSKPPDPQVETYDDKPPDTKPAPPAETK